VKSLIRTNLLVDLSIIVEKIPCVAVLDADMFVQEGEPDGNKDEHPC
jgi:hypothetical protein